MYCALDTESRIHPELSFYVCPAIHPVSSLLYNPHLPPSPPYTHTYLSLLSLLSAPASRQPASALRDVTNMAAPSATSRSGERSVSDNNIEREHLEGSLAGGGTQAAIISHGVTLIGAASHCLLPTFTTYNKHADSEGG